MYLQTNNNKRIKVVVLWNIQHREEECEMLIFTVWTL